MYILALSDRSLSREDINTHHLFIDAEHAVSLSLDVRIQLWIRLENAHRLHDRQF